MFGSIIGGIADIGSSLIQASSSKKIAARQMSFQERMSNTAYQRAVDDMRKAELNPALMYSKGSSGASTPPGASSEPLDVSGAVSSAMQLSRTRQELKNMKSSDKLIQAQEFAAREQAKANAASARKLEADAKLSEAAIPGAENRKHVQESPVGPTSAYVQELMNTFGPIAGGIMLAAGARNFRGMAGQAMTYVRKGKAMTNSKVRSQVRRTLQSQKGYNK